MQRTSSAAPITMRSAAVICTSPHHGNTRRIAEAIAAVLAADVFAPEEAPVAALASYDLVGFGSGIYFGRHHRTLRQLVDSAPALPRASFLFSTAGLPWLSPLSHASLRRRLTKRGCRIVGEFSCAGWDTVGPLAWIGGLNRHRPDANDLERAREFARSLAVDRQTTSNEHATPPRV